MSIAYSVSYLSIICDYRISELQFFKYVCLKFKHNYIMYTVVYLHKLQLLYITCKNIRLLKGILLL